MLSRRSLFKRLLGIPLLGLIKCDKLVQSEISQNCDNVDKSTKWGTLDDFGVERCSSAPQSAKISEADIDMTPGSLNYYKGGYFWCQVDGVLYFYDSDTDMFKPTNLGEQI